MKPKTGYTKLPSVWHFGDFIAFGLGGVLCVVLLIYGLLGHTTGSVQWPYIVVATAAAFFFIYWRVIVLRQNEIKGFVLVGGPKYGFLVNFGDYKPPLGKEEELEHAISDTIKRWEVCFSAADIDKAVTADYIWVWFKPGTLDLPSGMPGKVAGYTIARKMVVGYRSPEIQLNRTAFAHELGHIIQGYITHDWDQKTHHARAKANGLP
jgi:hypothetical protein